MHPQQPGQQPGYGPQGYQQGYDNPQVPNAPGTPPAQQQGPDYPAQFSPQGATLSGPPPKSHAPLFVLAIIAVAALLGSLVGVGVAAGFDDSINTEEKARLRERTSGTGKIGQRMIDQTLEITVDSVECGISEIPGPGIHPSEPDQGQFCKVGITVKNRKDDTYDGLMSINAETTDGKSHGFATVPTSDLNSNGAAYQNLKLEPGESETVVYVFDVPTQTQLATILFDDDQYSTRASGGVKINVE